MDRCCRSGARPGRGHCRRPPSGECALRLPSAVGSAMSLVLFTGRREALYRAERGATLSRDTARTNAPPPRRTVPDSEQLYGLYCILYCVLGYAFCVYTNFIGLYVRVRMVCTLIHINSCTLIHINTLVDLINWPGKPQVYHHCLCTNSVLSL